LYTRQTEETKNFVWPKRVRAHFADTTIATEVNSPKEFVLRTPEQTDCLCLIIVLADTPCIFINFAGRQQSAILRT
jgi:hypothetical protein